jgi:hypothetical protein
MGLDLGIAKALQRFSEQRQVGALVGAQVVVGQHGGIHLLTYQ